MLDDYVAVAARRGAFVAVTDSSSKQPAADEIVGVLVLIESADGILLDNIAVHPTRQGSGIGAKLLGLADDYALKLGFDALNLYTHELMTENIAMYQRAGFVETKRVSEHGFARVYMCKHFNSGVG